MKTKMVIEYFSHMDEEELQKLLVEYYKALESNNTTFNFNDYTVNTSFANYILKYNDIDLNNMK